MSEGNEMKQVTNIVMARDVSAVLGLTSAEVSEMTVMEFIRAAWRAGFDLDIREGYGQPGIVIQMEDEPRTECHRQ